MMKFRSQVPLAPFTSFHIGGEARHYAEPEGLPAFREAISWALNNEVPFFVLGGGTNVLVHDSGFEGLVINTRKLSRFEIVEESVNAECGVKVDDLVNACAEHWLTGLEFAAGLPGTIGGALFMNARAYEGSFSDVVEKVIALRIVKKDVQEQVLYKSDMGFGYKSSNFQKGDLFVSRVTFKLNRGPEYAIRARTDENRKKREGLGQYLFPNAGCIFKNIHESGIQAGKLIEELGLKGRRVGGAEVFDRHANFIINRGNATAEDVHRLIRLIEAEAWEKKGMKLEREIVLVGNWPEDNNVAKPHF